ncbi:MAG: cation:proton antiporter [Candidatus Diapherotrites archaeon]|nr:cation:proton antiporter [Candidatus Diapherotrites archaeon]
MSGIELFIQMAQITVAATIVSLLLRKLKQPNLFAYIIAGIAIGPLFIGKIDFSFLHLPFQLGIMEITPEISLLSELGAAFLLFSIGIETSVKKLLETGKMLLLGTLLQVLGVIGITVLLTYSTGLLPLETSLFIGTIISFSSTMIVIKLLADKKETNTLNGRIMIATLLIQDFLVIIFVPLLQNVSEIGNPTFFAPIIGKTIALLVIALLANRFIFPRLFAIASKENELFFLSSISTAFLFIGVSYLLDIPITIGAFIGGLALSSLPYNTAVFSKVRALRDFFLTIFFVSLGAGLTFGFGQLPILLMMIIIMIIFVFKPLVFFLVGLLSGYGSRLGLELGMSLAQVSEFGFVIATMGATATLASGNPIIPKDLLSFIVAIAAISMIITPHLMNYAPRTANAFSTLANKFFKFDKIPLFNKRIDKLRKIPQEKTLEGHIIIIGGGLVGRRLARKMRVKHNVLLVDSDPEVVVHGQKEGLEFVYGTAEDAELLEKLGLDKAKVIVITMITQKIVSAFIDQIKRIAPKARIFTTANHYYDAVDYYKKGVDFVLITPISGMEKLYQSLESFMKTGKIFINETAKKAHIKYLKEQAEEEQKYKQRIIS